MCKVSIFRDNETNDNGDEIGLSHISAEFDFYKSQRDHFMIYEAFSAEIKKLGLRLVPNGDQTTEIGGGKCFRVEI